MLSQLMNISNFISPGDVFVLKDNLSKEKDTPPNNTRLIRFQRPAIIINTGFKISTVIPLTTNDNSPEIAYDIKVSTDICSRALFSQITTVDNFRLGKKLGVIRPTVFKNLLEVYTNYVLGKLPLYLSRSIPIPTYGMDMISFDNFAYYRNDNDHDNIILAINNMQTGYYLNTIEHKPIDIMNGPAATLNTTIYGIIGRDICLDSVHFLSAEYRNTTWTCVGYETLEHTRTMIHDSLNEIYGITPSKLVHEKMDAVMEYQLAVTISRSFSDKMYLQAFDFIMNCDLEELFSERIYQNDFLVDNCSGKNVSYVITTMRDLHFYRINVLDCSIAMLEWLNANYTKKFYNKAMSYSDNLISTETGYSLNIDPQVYNGVQYNEQNLVWLGNYISAALDTLNEKAKLNASIEKKVEHKKPYRKAKRK